MMFFTVLGMGVAVLVIGLALYAVTEVGPINGQGFMFTFCGFGFVYAEEGTQLNHNINNVRKTEGRRWFFTAPYWFNKYVANWGGVKK